MSRRKLSALRRRELAQDARQRLPRGYQGIGPRVALEQPHRLERQRARQSMLVAYAVALAQKRGQLGIGLRDLNDVSARIDEDDLPGAALVHFWRNIEVPARYSGTIRKHETAAPFASIELQHLDWVPADPIEETLGEDMPCAA